MVGEGRGAYAGQPLHFACAKCRRSPGYRDGRGFIRRSVGTNYRTTGKYKYQKPKGGNWHSWPEHSYQYECLDCGHVGWSRHPRVQMRYRAEHATGIDWAEVEKIMRLSVRSLEQVRVREDARTRDPEGFLKLRRKIDGWG